MLWSTVGLSLRTWSRYTAPNVPDAGAAWAEPANYYLVAGAFWCQPEVEGRGCGFSSGTDPTSRDSSFGCYQW